MVIDITIMVVTMPAILIPRTEAAIARRAGRHMLIFGRRKVGKTFIVKNFIEHDIYVLVKRGGGFFVEGFGESGISSYDQFMAMLQDWMKNGEFQRLPGDFHDALQTMDMKGQLILTGSSFHLVKQLLSVRSPVLGMFSEIRVSLIKPVDIFAGLGRHAPPVTAFELSPFLRDPWTLPYFRGERTSIPDILQLSREAIRALIGEVFLEEDKSLSNVYEGIIRSLACGKWELGEVADRLFSRKVIDKPDPHLIRPYFNNMEAMDLVKRVPIFGMKKFRYLLSSPIMELGYILDERYNFFQQDISGGRIDGVVREMLPIHIERFCGELFAQIYDGVYNYFYSKDFDIDFIITRGNRPVACGEVKWSASPTSKDVGLFLDRTRHLPGDKIFFSRKRIDDARVISLTPSTLLAWTRKRMR